MTDARNIERLPVGEIVIPEGRRQCQEDKVKDLADSMRQLGLLSPIVVRMLDDEHQLVDGLHRLTAAQALGWQEIDCRIVEADDRRARMIEIAANLHRAELIVLERAEAINEWVRLADQEPQEIFAQVAQKIGRGRPEGGQSAAAREIGVDRDAVRRAQKIAALPAEAKVTARHLDLADNQTALLKAAKSEDPVASLQQHGKRRRHTPEELSRRRTKTAEAEKVPARASDMQDALNRVATMLIDALGDRIAELVSVLETVTATALAKALREGRPELFNQGHHEERPPEPSPKVLYEGVQPLRRRRNESRPEHRPRTYS